MVEINPVDFPFYDEEIFNFMVRHFIPIQKFDILYSITPNNDKILCTFLAKGKYAQQEVDRIIKYQWITPVYITRFGIAYRNHLMNYNFFYWNEIPRIKFKKKKIIIKREKFRPIYKIKRISSTIEEFEKIKYYFSNFCKLLYNSFDKLILIMNRCTKDLDLIQQILDKKSLNGFLEDCRIYYNAGNKVNALTILKNSYQFISDENEKIDLLFLIALLHKTDRNYKSAITAYDNILKLNPHNQKAIEERSYNYYAQLYYQIEPKIRKRAKNSHKDALKNVIKGADLEKKGKKAKAKKIYDKSLEYFNTASDYDPYNINIWEDKKDFLEFLGKSDEAKKCQEEKRKYEPPEGYSFLNFIPEDFDQNKYESDLREYKILKYTFQKAILLISEEDSI